MFKPKLFWSAVVAGILLTGCNFNVDLPTPTAEGIEEDSLPNLESTTTPTVTLAPSLQPTPEVAMLESPMPSGTPLPPTITPSPSPTLGPYEHPIQSGETLLFIIQQYNYFDFSVISAVEALNPGIPDLDNLPAGRILYIPRPTATFTPAGFEQTEVANATLGITLVSSIPTNAPIECYTVQEGDTAIGIAQDYNITLEVLKQLNPDIYFSPQCDLNNRSGGPECTISLDIGQCVRVPFPTPTTTLSPTPSGSETRTPTPTYSPPRVISPPGGAIITPGVLLEWVSAGVLDSDEAYFVRIYDASAPETIVAQGVSRDNSFQIPAEAVPASGQERAYEWTVAVAKRNEQGAYRIVGAESRRYPFTLRN